MGPIYVNARFLSQKTTGVQRFAIELSIRLKKTYPSIVFVCPKKIHSSNQHIADILQVQRIGFFDGHLWEQVDLPFFLLKRGNPLLLNLCNTAPVLYQNKISTIHDLAFLHNPQWFSLSFRVYYRMLIPVVANTSKHIFTVSEFSKCEIVRHLGIPAAKISVAYNGVDKRFMPSCGHDMEPYVLFVGSLDPRKNMERLLSSFKYLPDSLKLKVVGGKGRSFQEFKNTSHDIGNIEFLGYLSDEELIMYYQNAKCFVFPSLYEGFGLPPLEAQAAGIPVAISDIEVFKEIFGESALYFNPLDSKSIAETIAQLMRMDLNARNLLVQKGIVNSRRFSWDVSATQISSILYGLG